MRTILAMPLGTSADALLAGRRAREIAGLLDLTPRERTRIGSAVAELAESALEAESAGSLEFAIEEAPGRRSLGVTLTGVEPAALVPPADAEPKLDLAKLRSLVTRVDARADGGTARVRLTWALPDEIFVPPLEELAQALHGRAGDEPSATVDELRRRNGELVQTLATLQTRERELLELNRQLGDTNAGIRDLLGELDQSAAALRRADEPASRFLRTVSHELRTPLYAARGLLEELALNGSLDATARSDVELLDRTVTEALTIVNDQLDLLRLQADRAVVRLADVDVDKLLQGLRGTLRVLRRSPDVELVVEAAPDVPRMRTDPGKLAQILRNLIANALKFTEAGEVRVRARHDPAAAAVAFIVSDTGTGVAPEHLGRIFEEYGQVPEAQPEGVASTGLGLPLARALATLLGGSVTATSAPGRGSVFTAVLPVRAPQADGP